MNKKRREFIEVTRTINEIRINNYNTPIFKLWGGNMDIQPVPQASGVLNRYITNYITKGEKGATAQMIESLDYTRSKASK